MGLVSICHFAKRVSLPSQTSGLVWAHFYHSEGTVSLWCYCWWWWQWWWWWCVCVEGVCMCTWACKYTHVYTGDIFVAWPGDNLSYSSSGTTYLIFLRHGFSLAQNSPQRLNWTTYELQGSVCLFPHCLDYRYLPPHLNFSHSFWGLTWSPHNHKTNALAAKISPQCPGGWVLERELSTCSKDITVPSRRIEEGPVVSLPFSPS